MSSVDGSYNQYKQMLVSQVAEMRHHVEELESLIKSGAVSQVDAWLIAKAERAATDLSDITHYIEGEMHLSSNYAQGGRLKFKDKVASIAKKLYDTKVPDRLRKDYGSRYNAEEAKEAAQRIVGAQLRDEKKYQNGGFVDEVTDLFYKIPSLPEDVQAILQEYQNEEPTYMVVEELLQRLRKKGYTFDYGLDYEPYNLRKL